MRTFAEALDYQLVERSPRPRTAGVTMVIDLALPNSFIASGLPAYGEYIDLVKLVDLHLTWPEDQVREKIALYREAGVLVEPGGVIVEIGRAHAEGRSDERKLLERLAAMGFNALEISATTKTRSLDDETELVPIAKDLGFSVYGEVGQKFAKGDTTRTSENVIDHDVTLREITTLLQAGCEHVLWEGHVLRHIFGNTPAEILTREQESARQILPIVDAVGQDKLIFEVSSLVPFELRRASQFWLVHLFGPDANVGNVRFEEVPFMEHTRRGTWPIFGLGQLGDHPWIHALQAGATDQEWWKVPVAH